MSVRFKNTFVAAVLCISTSASTSALPMQQFTAIEKQPEVERIEQIKQPEELQPEGMQQPEVERIEQIKRPEELQPEGMQQPEDLEYEEQKKLAPGAVQQPGAPDDENQTQGNTILQAPETLEAAAVTYQSVTLTWSEVAGAAGYQVEYTLDGTEYQVLKKTKPGVHTYKCKKLLTGKTYTFRVCALDESGKAGNYTLQTAKPVLKKSKILKAAVTQPQVVSVEWKKIPGADQYQLFRKSNADASYQLVSTTPELTYEDTNVWIGNSYTYYVQAVRIVEGQGIKGKASKKENVSFGMSSVQLETCQAVDHHSIQLTWQKADTATGYYLYRSKKQDGSYKKIKTIRQNTQLTYTDTKVVPGKEFYYKICTYVQAPDQTQIQGEMSAPMSAKTQLKAPVLTGVNANIKNRSLSLAWEKSEDASGYRIYRSSYPNKKFGKIAELSNHLLVGYEDRSVKPGGTYYYRIKAVYKNAGQTGVSDASDTKQGDVLPGAPIGLTVRQSATDVLEVSWNASDGAQSYHLYRAESSKGTYTCIAQGLTDTKYTDAGLKSDKTYYYRVSADGVSGEGTKCMPVSYLVGGVSLNTRTLKVCKGVSKTLKVTTYRKGSVIWNSSDPKIATVNSDGVVTGVSYGTVQVTATVAGKRASATVSVTPGIKNGIDVSSWQPEVDWERVKNSGVEFAFLRISNHYLEDFTFETKYADATMAGMPVGVYCYSRATTVEEAKEEARIILEILKGRKLDYPIALDMEDEVHKSASMTKDTLHAMIQAFQQEIENAGYEFALYSYLSFLNTNLDKTRLTGLDLWVARYGNISAGSGYTGAGNVKYWQYNSGAYAGSDFHVDGITDEAGNLVEVDVNIEYGA